MKKFGQFLWKCFTTILQGLVLILTFVWKFLTSRLVWKRTALIFVLLYSLYLAQNHYYNDVLLFQNWNEEPTALFWNHCQTKPEITREALWRFEAEQRQDQYKLIQKTRGNAVRAFYESAAIVGLGLLSLFLGWGKKANS